MKETCFPPKKAINAKAILLLSVNDFSLCKELKIILENIWNDKTQVLVQVVWLEEKLKGF